MLLLTIVTLITLVYLLMIIAFIYGLLFSVDSCLYCLIFHEDPDIFV